MAFADFEPGDPRLVRDVLPVLVQLRPHLTPETFDAIYREGHPQGLRFIALYDRECVAVAGWRIIATTIVERKLYVDDLVTDVQARGNGYGRELLDELTQRARAAGCAAIDLDSGTHRKDAHRFLHARRPGHHQLSFRTVLH
jgi:GNAT superfamily N-acetyltransferase